MSFNIMIVDDSTIIRTMIKRTITLAGIPTGIIVEAQNGAEALVSLGENWIDLIFTDINMPVMDGVEMLERISREERISDTPVIVVSTEGSETKIDRLTRMDNVKAFIRKPFAPENLRDAVEAALSERIQEAANA
ncbi:MAG TPA: response regulator [bacterium]|nr:MAG: hypothetical protein BWY28_00021 [bacterium ADurb.Bin236]HOY62307.1 response regulator [bacterium]HPI75853.1 response regulator [bacterium]HPN93152.1 response regulator [bacterium]